MTLTTPTQQQAFNSREPQLVNACPDKKTTTAFSVRNGAPTRCEEVFLSLFVQIRQEMADPVTTKSFLQIATINTPCLNQYPSVSPFLHAGAKHTSPSVLHQTCMYEVICSPHIPSAAQSEWPPAVPSPGVCLRHSEEQCPWRDPRPDRE